jgi:hypothetical protein
MQARRARVALALAVLMAASRSAWAADAPRVAFLGFSLINTSLEPTRSEERRRVEMLDALFRRTLDESGRFVLVALPPDVEKRIATGAAIMNCNGCERDLARQAGADWAAWGTVQKVSNLILNINVYMEDARSGTLQFAHSVDIRGNTDESWRHGLDYMLRHYLLGEP